MTIPADAVLIASLLAAAVLEELIFRLGIQESLLRWSAARGSSPPGWVRSRYRGVSASNLATAALFALAHALARSPWLGLASLAPALLLGWLYERRRQVWPCMALHAALNLIWLLAARTLPPSLLP
ncbi:MAG: JDVT-CTERM system glutamic-type intramembrane protease [Stagnimonas sp.]|nr:JDVT-CTERM system glutamic-type intramembrane protease [Stagnimonas sp.]